MEVQSPMNMSMLTLERINELIKDGTDYRVQGHPIGIRANVLELYKELRPYLTDKCKKDSCKDNNCELHIGDSIRVEVGNHDMAFDRTGRVLYFDPDMIKILDKFDDWIRIKLYAKGLLLKKGEDDRSMFK